MCEAFELNELHETQINSDLEILVKIRRKLLLMNFVQLLVNMLAVKSGRIPRKSVKRNP